MQAMVKIKDIQPNGWNKRGDEAIKDLAASIAARGLLEEIVVRPVGSKYEIVAGERRWRACMANKWRDIRCNVMEIDEATARVITFVENAERKKLTAFEEAEEIAGMFGAGATVEEIAAQIGRPAVFVRRRLALRSLDLAAIEATAGEIALQMEQVPLLALELLAAATEEKRSGLPAWALESVAQMRQWLVEDQREVQKAPWRKKDVFDGLTPCAECPKRTGAQESLFPELEDGQKDLCLDGACWAAKSETYVLGLAEQKRNKGQEVLLIGDDFDTVAGEENGVQRRSDYIVSTKGEPGAQQAIVFDGAEAGKTVWVRPFRREAGTRPKLPPDRQKWKWIGKEAMAKLDVRLEAGADGCGIKLDWEAVAEDMMRYGVEARGPDWHWPAKDSVAETEIEMALGPGLHAVLKRLGGADRTEQQDRDDLRAVLGCLFGEDAGAMVERLEWEWDEVAARDAKQIRGAAKG